MLIQYYIAITSMFILGFILGYKFCKFRYQIDKLMKVTQLLTDVLNNNISSEYALEQIKELMK